MKSGFGKNPSKLRHIGSHQPLKGAFCQRQNFRPRNKMNEKAGKVAGGRGPAIEILQARVGELEFEAIFF